MSIDDFVYSKLERVWSTFVDTFRKGKFFSLVGLGKLEDWRNSRPPPLPALAQNSTWLMDWRDSRAPSFSTVSSLWWLRTPKGRLAVKSLQTSPSKQTAKIFYNCWGLLKSYFPYIEFVSALSVPSSFFINSFPESLFFSPPGARGWEAYALF